MTLKLIVTCFALCFPIGFGAVFTWERFKHPAARACICLAAYLLFILVGVCL